VKEGRDGYGGVPEAEVIRLRAAKDPEGPSTAPPAIGSVAERSPAPAKTPANADAPLTPDDSRFTSSRLTPHFRPLQQGLPGMDGLAHSPLDDGALRAGVLQRCIETLAVNGPLRARDLAARLEVLDARIDKRLINRVLSREGVSRVQRDPATGVYRLRPKR
jgi:hypothetical protein